MNDNEEYLNAMCFVDENGKELNGKNSQWVQWIPFDSADESLKSHCSYIVTDGKVVAVGYFYNGEFVGCEEDIVGKITHWMPFPKLPKI